MRLETEVNEGNVLGTKGKVLAATHNLFYEYWRSPQKSISPAQFKFTFEKHAVSFSGNAQHDAADFFSQLVDLLHEDSCKVLTKQIVQPLEFKDSEDSESVSRAFWLNFLKRNYSWFTAHFYGQLRSTIRCACGNSALHYDPFLLLSLPIPSCQQKVFPIIFKAIDRKPLRLSFKASTNQNFKDLKVSDIIQRFSFALDRGEASLKLGVFGLGLAGQLLEPGDCLNKIEQLLKFGEKFSASLYLIEAAQPSSDAVEVYFRVFLPRPADEQSKLLPVLPTQFTYV